MRIIVADFLPLRPRSIGGRDPASTPERNYLRKLRFFSVTTSKLFETLLIFVSISFGSTTISVVCSLQRKSLHSTMFLQKKKQEDKYPGNEET